MGIGALLKAFERKPNWPDSRSRSSMDEKKKASPKREVEQHNV